MGPIRTDLMTLPQPRRRTLVDAALWAAVAAAVLCAFRFRLQHAHGIAANYDDGVYWQTGLALADGARAYDQVFHAQPPLFVWLLGLPFRWTDDPAVGVQAGRLLMAGFAVMLTAIAAGIATTLRGARAGMLAALGVSAVPLIQDFSFQLGADIPAATLGGAALWAALCARTAAPDHRRWLWLATGGLVALAGEAVRYERARDPRSYDDDVGIHGLGLAHGSRRCGGRAQEQ